MSDRKRKTIGTVLMILSVTAAFAGVFPAGTHNISKFTGQHICPAELHRIPHISESDLTNSGSLSQLTGLPGIGEATARMILDERETNGGFVYPEDLMAVKGIGKKKMEAIRPLLLIETYESED